MEAISKSIDTFKKRKVQKPPSHEKAASVNEIIALLGETKIYNFGYWLRKVGSVKYGTVMAIVKEASQLESKYSKGGYITNQLKKYNDNQRAE